MRLREPYPKHRQHVLVRYESSYARCARLRTKSDGPKLFLVGKLGKSGLHTHKPIAQAATVRITDRYYSRAWVTELPA